jgi:hypothetical protein
MILKVSLQYVFELLKDRIMPQLGGILAVNAADMRRLPKLCEKAMTRSEPTVFNR